MPKFNDSENRAFVLLKPGDYVYRVLSMEHGLQTGTGKTAGSPYWELKLQIEGDAGGLVFERLIDHEVCAFKIDTFLKSAGAAPPLGTAFEFVEEAAEAAGCLHIDPIGLRGWCHITQEDFTKRGETKPMKKNKVGTFLTDRPKLPRAERPPEEAPASAPAGDDEALPF